MKKFTVKEIQQNKIVLECENGETVALEKASFPKTIQVGDALNFEAQSCYLDKSESEKRQRKIENIMKPLLEE